MRILAGVLLTITGTSIADAFFSYFELLTFDTTFFVIRALWAGALGLLCSMLGER